MVQRDIARHAMAELGSQGFVALGVLEVRGPQRMSEVAQRLGADTAVIVAHAPRAD